MAAHPFIRETWMQTEIIAYCAGLFDGEGYVGIYPRKPRPPQYPYVTYSLHCKIGMSTPEPLKLLHRLFGGSLRKCKKIEHRKIIWVWEIACRSCEKFLNAIIKYTKVKTPQIRVALKYLKLTAHRSGKARSALSRKGQEQCYQSLKDLKK